MDRTRLNDYKVIEKGLKASDPNERRQAKNARDKVIKEDSWTRSARESLLKEVRKGNKGDSTYIRDEIVKHEGRKTSGERVSFGFHIPKGIL